MGEKIECDILIVGAGPAGSRAAATAAEAGCSTLLIDAKLRIGEQPHCGEFVPARLFSEFELDRGCIVQNVNFMETRILDASGRDTSETVLKSSRIQSPGFMINRVKLDRDLARKAAFNGAMVLCATRLIGRENRSWIIQSRGQKSLVTPKLTIAADGAASTVAAILGMERPDLLQGLQMEVPLNSPLEDTFVFLDRNLIGGYGWLFPKETTANVGIGVVPRSGWTASRLLERFLDGLHKNSMVKPGRLAISAGLIPVSGLRKDLVVDDVIFCGDAAGLTHPITGAGIPQAILSGELAGRAAAAALTTESKEPLIEYQNQIRGTYGGIINHALSKRAFMMRFWNDQDFVATCEETWIGFKGYKKRIRTIHDK
ncbi:MAG: geranylgeranyl reductase family protein [Desulfomonilaceae bacterium]